MDNFAFDTASSCSNAAPNPHVWDGGAALRCTPAIDMNTYSWMLTQNVPAAIVKEKTTALELARLFLVLASPPFPVKHASARARRQFRPLRR